MLDNVYGGEYITVSGGNSYMPYINPTGSMSGMVRFVNNNMEIYDGSTWHRVTGGSAHVNLDSRALAIMKWAEEKMRREQEIADMIKTHPGVADLANKVALAEEQLAAFVELAKKEDQQ